MQKKLKCHHLKAGSPAGFFVDSDADLTAAELVIGLKI